MSLNLNSIIYESGDYYAIDTGKWYEIYKTGVCAATRCATLGYSRGINRVKSEIERRERSDGLARDFVSRGKAVK